VYDGLSKIQGLLFDDDLLRDKLDFFLREISFIIIFSSANFLSLQR